MGKNSPRSNTYKAEKKKKKKGPIKLSLVPSFLKDRRLQLAFGFFLIATSFFLLVAFLSYIFTGKADQSIIDAYQSDSLNEIRLETQNWFGFLGALISHQFIFKWFGVSSFLIPPLFLSIGYEIVFKKPLFSLTRITSFSLFFLFWISLLLGYILIDTQSLSIWGFLAGGIGYEMAVFFDGLVGWGTFIVLILSLLIFLIFYFNITQVLGFKQLNFDKEPSEDQEQEPNEGPAVERAESENEEIEEEIPDEIVLEAKNSPKEPKKDSDLELQLEEELEEEVPEQEEPITQEITPEKKEPEFLLGESEVEKTVASMGHYDPKLDLSSYQYPSTELLVDHSLGKVKVTKEELEQNKDKIVETLTNFKIGISSIKATIGPTVTLYEIVPEAGVKISKIKNLEDDIALSLSALGIRIIAPIPGKGTIGIEVPNKNRELVAMKSIVTTEKFSKSEFELPIILGKTISNEVYVTDLAKMPHLLMAGATGQGKSVGLNVLITSLLYKKHPSQLKFVMVDPKKVELTLFNKIERHFLAKLPNSEEAIITENKKVVHTLNSLCIEMDNRYELLKDAGCRNIKEYNKKFINRKLNPENGHRYLPYVVLIIDELADLMMTSGKEVETPIARLAQLARAIGIHLVIATQRPSVNVITGIIKANFPARLSFRVTQKVDSRTILDSGGAEQLVGMGDMLLSMGSDIVRIQCPFVDTPEVDEICDFIGSQRGYESAYMLPEFEDENESGPGDVDLSDRDALFEDAARLIVLHQQGSTSLIQRKLKLGYNRAGRLIDQLEAAGIVGSFEGSKAREVLIPDEYSLEQLLNDLDN
ncbi:MAG: DNA translocase FtsK 4TM domain-containing protein [Bacteroidota bacterium]